MKILSIVSILSFILLTACGEATSIGIIGGADGPTAVLVSEKGEKAMYEQITAEEAKRIMDSEDDIIILDVREQDEYDSGHISGAILLRPGSLGRWHNIPPKKGCCFPGLF